MHVEAPPNPGTAPIDAARQPALAISVPQTYERLRSMVGGAEPEISCDVQDELRLAVLFQPIDEILDARCVSL